MQLTNAKYALKKMEDRLAAAPIREGHGAPPPSYNMSAPPSYNMSNVHSNNATNFPNVGVGVVQLDAATMLPFAKASPAPSY